MLFRSHDIELAELLDSDGYELHHFREEVVDGRLVSRYYAMQIWVQPDKLANFGLTVADLHSTLILAPRRSNSPTCL